MLLITHIVIALSGLAFAGAAYMRPTRTKINASFGLLFSTILSGVLLVVLANASIIHTCIMGLTFTAIMYAGIAAAKHKLSLQS